MRISDDWKDFELIDCSNGEKLERWGNIFLIRPDPQIIWNTKKIDKNWFNPTAKYERANTGGGHWIEYKPLPEKLIIKYKDLAFNIKAMNFKHTGLFPEQAVNWDLLRKIIDNSEKKLKVLNLFGYTGGATIAALKNGASVCHVDASKGMVQWAKENAVINNVLNEDVRWIVDDCEKFVQREIRRNNKYDIIIMDPPSYGRGPKGEIWKLENKIFNLISLCEQILTENPTAVFINSYTTGLSPSVMEYMLNSILLTKHGGITECSEIGLRNSSNGLVLPCGSTSIWMKKI